MGENGARDLSAFSFNQESNFEKEHDETKGGAQWPTVKLVRVADDDCTQAYEW